MRIRIRPSLAPEPRLTLWVPALAATALSLLFLLALAIF
jgi:hypothetical protein